MKPVGVVEVAVVVRIISPYEIGILQQNKSNFTWNFYGVKLLSIPVSK